MNRPAEVSEPHATLRFIGIFILLAIVVWQIAVYLPTLQPEYPSSGDHHMHVVVANDLLRVINSQKRILGWSYLYAGGAPMFLLRPPGLYIATVVTHLLTHISVEQSLKFVVLVGLSFYPLSVFIGCRLLRLRFDVALYAAALSPLAISTWGHTIDAYFYLGVYKQLLAVFLLPMAMGALWRVLTSGDFGVVFALLFSVLFLAHPYIGYGLVMIAPAMLIACATREVRWDSIRALGSAAWWSLAAGLIIAWWVIPFFFSTEIQQAHPFLSARKYFDVVLCTTSETIRQLMFGGALDTSRWSGSFGHHEWAWIPNASEFRAPILSALLFVGLTRVILSRQNSVYAFLSLAFIVSFALFAGPDDFPILDSIPFAKAFQNVHATALFELLSFIIGGVGCSTIVGACAKIERRNIGVVASMLISVILIAGWYSAARERTIVASDRIETIHGATTNGDLAVRTDSLPYWQLFKNVVHAIQASPEEGATTGEGFLDDDGMLLDLMPLMVNRPHYINGFEETGGEYEIISQHFRTDSLRNYALQRLFNIRFAVSGKEWDTKKEPWPATMQEIYSDRYWQLFKVAGDFAQFEALPADTRYLGFLGNDQEWSDLCLYWLRALAKNRAHETRILDLRYVGDDSISTVKALLSGIIVGDGTVPDDWSSFEHISVDKVLRETDNTFFSDRSFPASEYGGTINTSHNSVSKISNIKVSSLESPDDSATIESEYALTPLLMKRAFYQSWRETVDQKSDVPILRVAPGMQLSLIPAGRHEITWHYPGPDYAGASSACLVIGIVALLIGYLIQKSRFIRKRLEKARAYGYTLISIPKRILEPVWSRRVLLPQCIWLVFAVTLLVKVISEEIRKVPVTIFPKQLQTIRTNERDGADVFWNYLVNVPREQQRFTVQIASDQNFTTIIAADQVKSDHARLRADWQTSTPYFSRVRYDGDGQEHAWTTAKKFFITPGDDN